LNGVDQTALPANINPPPRKAAQPYYDDERKQNLRPLLLVGHRTRRRLLHHPNPCGLIMKTLLERLKPEYAAALEDVRDQYAGVHYNITKALAEAHYVTKLTIETVSTMGIFLGGEGLSDPWSYFDEDSDDE
jgi:hypothetical protein